MKEQSVLDVYANNQSQLKSTLRGSFPDGLHDYDPNLLLQPTGKLNGYQFRMDASTIEAGEIQLILDASAGKDIMLEPVARKSQLCIVEASKDQVCSIILHIFLACSKYISNAHICTHLYTFVRRTARSSTMQSVESPPCARRITSWSSWLQMQPSRHSTRHARAR